MQRLTVDRVMPRTTQSLPVHRQSPAPPPGTGRGPDVLLAGGMRVGSYRLLKGSRRTPNAAQT